MLEVNRETVDTVLSQAEDSIAKREETIHLLREELRKLRAENARLKDENGRAMRVARDADGAMQEKVRAERQKQSQLIFEFQQAKERSAAELASVTSQLNAKFEDIRDLRERLALAEAREDQLRAALQNMEEQQRGAFENDANRVEDLRQQALKANQYAADMERKLGALMNEKMHAREHSDRSAKQLQQLQRKLTDAEQELVHLRAQIDAGALIDAAQVRDIVEEKRQLQDELNAAHINNIRLLRIISESNELSQFINFNEISNEFVFCGYRLLGTTSQAAEAAAAAAGLVSDSGVVRGGGGIGIVAGKSPTSFNRKLGRGQLNELREAVEEENVFLRHRHVDVGALMASSGGASGGGDLLSRFQAEKDFWIPHAVFVEAQKFKARVMPNQPIEAFYEFFVEINRIWRSRMASRVAAGKALVKAKLEAKATKVKKTTNVHDDERVAEELDRLRREVRQRFQCKSTLQLFQTYDNVAKQAIKRRIDAEERAATLANRLNEALAARDPTARTLDAALAAIIANSHSMANYMNEKIIALVADVRLLMRNVAPDLAKYNLQSVSRVLDEFFNEVYTVSQESVRALHKCAEEADNCRARCASKLFSSSGSRDAQRSTREYVDGDETFSGEDEDEPVVSQRFGVRTHYM